MNESFSFSNRRINCPCGESHSGFAPLAQHEGEPFGKCFVCDKFFPPPTDTRRYKPLNRRLAQPIEKPTNQPQVFADDMEAMATINQLLVPSVSLEAAIDAIRVKSALHAYLINCTEKPDVFITWSVGVNAAGNILFWHENECGLFVNCKVVAYSGMYRDKTQTPRYIYSKKDGFRQCLYGAFQLHRTYRNGGYAYSCNSPVILVESEKTAIICSVHEPQYLWLATGGATSLTREKAELLRNFKDVRVWYDADSAGRQGAQKALNVLRQANVKARTYDPLPNVDDGTDAADLINSYLIRRAV